MQGIPRQKRASLIVFGAIVALFFAGYAIFRGLGDPGVPDDAVAVVEDAPDGIGTITKEDLDRALEQAAARAGVQKVPKPGTKEYDDIEQAATGDLLDSVWIQGEAAELGITTTDKQIADELETIKKQNFRTEKEFQQFLDQSGFTPEDVETRVRLQILSTDIQTRVTRDVGKVSNSEIDDFYEASKSQFEQPETRDVRLILNKEKAKVEEAKAALEKDSSEDSWQKVAKEFSTDPASRSNSGLRPSLSEGLLEQPLDSEIFDAAKGELVGPVKTPLGYYVFEVVKITQARTQPLNRQVREQIRQQLLQQEQQNTFSEFVNDYGSKWQSRTFCAAGYLTDRCANFGGSAHPATAPPACYEADPKGGIPPACPAPVTPLAPALPGSVTLLSPQGTRLPQRPIPAGLQPVEETGLPGAVPGAPSGVGAPPGTPTGP
ncbi:MAG: peptidyl-prolyl cis-trans isomerase [Actinomycetota bacterium]